MGIKIKSPVETTEVKPKLLDSLMKKGKTVTEQQAQAEQESAAQSIAKPLTKNKVEAKTEVVVQAEELIDLHKRLTESGAFDMLKRIEEIKKILQGYIKDQGDSASPTIAFHFETEMGTITFSPCRKETEITDKEKLIGMLTPEVFVQVAKVTMTDAKKYLSESELAQICETSYGSRTMASVKYKED